MPGVKAPNRPGASFITEWELHRSAIIANDDPANPQDIVASVDLSRNEEGLANQIWVGVVRTAGAGTIDIAVYRKENGSWAALVPWKSEGSQAGLATLTTHKFTGLLAGLYKVVCTNITVGASWNVHVAHT